MAQINEDLEILKTARDNMKTALENKGQIVNKDIRTYASAITNIPSGSGSGDVKLFETVESMQADSTAQEGDLAVVYREELIGITEESEFDSCIFPNTVVLDEAFTDNIYGRFMAIGGGWFDGMIEMSSSGFNFDGYGESDEIRVEYTSSDGITYTRTDGGDALQEFGVIIKWEDYGEGFNSVIGDFMKISGSCFEGLYEYKSYIDKNYIHIPLLSGLSDITPSSCIFDGISYSPEFEVNKITNIAKKLYKDEDVSGYNMTYKDGHLVFMTELQSGVTYWTNEDKFEVYNATVMGGDYYEYILDLDNETYTKRLAGYANTYGSDLPHGRINYIPDGFVAMYVDYGDGYIINNGINSLQYYDGTNSTESTIENNPKNWFVPRTNYVLVTSQLDAIADYVYEKTFYGKNGVETGLLLKNISNKFDDKTAEIYSKIIEQYDNMDSIKITDTTWNVLSPNMKLIPVKSNGIPLIDTSEVTTFTNFSQYAQNLKHIPTLNMSNALNCFAMFSTCNNIISVSNLDCSKVQNVANMFWKCANLRDVPYMDLSNVTSSVAMFRDCYNLRNVPNYNLCNSLYTGEMFTGCYNLTQVPDFNITKSTSTQRMFIYCYNLLSAPNLDLRNVTSCNLMFYDCKSLMDVPFYNIKNAGLVYSMFYNCNNLSNNSLNNIMAMCTTITNTNVTNKTLKNIGLSQNQTNICKTLSNYSAFTSAGWTTGY